MKSSPRQREFPIVSSALRRRSSAALPCENILEMAMNSGKILERLKIIRAEASRGGSFVCDIAMFLSREANPK